MAHCLAINIFCTILEHFVTPSRSTTVIARQRTIRWQNARHGGPQFSQLVAWLRPYCGTRARETPPPLSESKLCLRRKRRSGTGRGLGVSWTGRPENFRLSVIILEISAQQRGKPRSGSVTKWTLNISSIRCKSSEYPERLHGSVVGMDIVYFRIYI